MSGHKTVILTLVSWLHVAAVPAERCQTIITHLQFFVALAKSQTETFNPYGLLQPVVGIPRSCNDPSAAGGREFPD